jgi:predicted nucleic acid-binding Zn ribbon protein
MFCPQCGKQLPDDSQFCSKCGRAIEKLLLPPAARRLSKPTHAGRWGLLAVLVVALVGVVLLNSRTTHSSPPVPAPPPVARMLRSETIANAAITVGAGSFNYYKFVVPATAAQASVDGHFSATGGFGNDIQVFVVNEDSFVNFQNGHPSDAYFNSGKVTQNTINALLPGPGTYYLVCNNRFGLLAPKTVELAAILHYVN